MIQLESNTATDEELKQALASLGATLEEEKAVEVPKEEPKSEPTGEPGADKGAAEPEGKTAPVTEPEKKESQEVPPGEPKEDKAKGGWARKVEKLTAKVDSLQDRLDEELGDKGRLRNELAEAKAELAKANTAKPAAEEVKGPVRPKRPTLAECDYDQDKLDTEMGKYDDLVDAYHKGLRDLDLEQFSKKERERQAQEAEEAKVKASNEAFGKRLDPGKAGYPDWEELFDEVGDREKAGEKSFVELSDVGAGYIWNESENPADLLHFLANDLVNGDGAEAERLLALTPFRLVIELKSIEDRIAQERKAAVTPPKKEEPPKAAVADAPETPVKEQPKPKKTPDAPIEPLGGRTSPNPGNLEKQIADAANLEDGGKEYRRLREQQKVAAARAAGRIPA